MQTMNVNIIPDKTAGVIKFSQYDVGRSVEVYLIDESGAYSIPSGATLTFHGTKPSGLGFTVSTTNEGTYTTITSTAEMTDEAGRFPVELVIANGNDVIGTANFTMWIERSPHPEGTTDGQAEVIVPVLTALIERAETAAESAIDSAEEARRQADRAFSGTPEGYDALVQSVTDVFNVYGAKNLLPSNGAGAQESASGITWTKNADGTVAASGTAVSSGAHFAYGYVTLPPGKYIISGVSGYNTSTVYIRLGINSYTGTLIKSTGDGDASFVLAETTNVYARLYVNAAAGTVDGVTFSPMIRHYSIADDTYVPYAMTNQQLTEQTTQVLAEDFVTLRTVGKIAQVVISGTATSTTFAIVPSGYRPSINSNAVGRYKATNGTYYPCLLTIATNGGISASYWDGSTARGIGEGTVVCTGTWIIP